MYELFTYCSQLDYGCLLQTMGEYTSQQVSDYGFNQPIRVVTDCDQQFNTIGHKQGRGTSRIRLSLSAQQQIKEISISYIFYYASAPQKLNYNSIELSDGVNTLTQQLQIDTFSPVSGCNYYTFNYKYSFSGVTNFDYNNIEFTMVCSTDELVSVQSVSYVTVYANYQCPLNCSSCDNNQNCKTCLSTSYYIDNNPTTNLKYCKIKCAPNQYATLPDQYSQSQTCKNCVQDCLSCTTGQDCTVCKDGYEFVDLALKCLPKCNSNQYRDSSFQCQNCMTNCLECTGPQNCKTCISPFTFNSSTFQCTCPSLGYFLDSNGNCNQCDPTCQSCSRALESNCTSCLTNWFSLGSYCYQWCPNNYQKQLSNFECVQCKQYIVPECQTCYQTCKSCPYNNQNTCLDCYGTRQISNGKCVCRNTADIRDLYFECSYNNVAVLQAILDNKTPTLKIDFGVNLQPITNLQCNQIFKNPTLSDIGKTATCKIVLSFIVVTLSNDSIIKENDEISLVNGILSYQVSSSTFIDTFYLLKVSQFRNQNPYLDFQYDQIQNTCNDIQFSVQPQNDAQRGFLSLQWSIEVEPLLDASIQSKVDQIIQTANTQKSQTLIIEKYLIPPSSLITMQFSYSLKVSWQDTQKFVTQYNKLKQVVISTIQSQYPPIFRYNSLSVFYSFYVQTCDQNGPNMFIEPLNISLQSQTMPTLNQSYQSFSDAQIQVDIQPYQIPISSVLDLNFIAILSSDQTLSAQNNLQIQPQLTNLFIKVQGGSTQLVNYKQPLLLQGIAQDFELQDQTAAQDINLLWSCQSIVVNKGDYQCYNQKQQVYTIQQTGLSITVPGKIFQAYQTLNFTLIGTKDSRKSQSSVLISFSEFDLPPLTVIFSNPSQLETVNLNEDITVKLIYGANVSSDILTYAGAIIYDDDVQGVIKFDFYEVKLRIWDYFSNVQSSNKIVQLRFTVYNPVYLMPSMSIINLNVNLPPNNCLLSVTPSTGEALITNFYIKMVGCSSDNLPITYQFFYYISQDDLNSEVQNPKIIKRRQILDQTIINEKYTFLPEGKITIMAQAIDSKLGVFNSTVQVQVSPLNCDEQTLLNIIDNSLNSKNIKQPTSQIVLNLSVIGEQISKSNPLFNLSSVNQRKILIIEQLIAQTNLLPKSSFLYTYSNKVISQLQSSLPAQSDTQVSSVLDQVNKQLQKQPLTNQLAKDNNIQLQNLVDSFKIINSTTQNISYNLLPTQINISNSICNQLNDQTLPNQGGIQLSGNLINLDCQLITDKNLQQYMQIYSNPPSNQTNIYNAANLVFSQNPYKETPEFKNYTQQLQQADPTLKISYNQVIQPNITNKNTNANQALNASIVLKFPNAKTSQNNSNMSCIQQQKTSWSTSGCETLKNKIINGYYCYCEKQNPTTIIDDLSSLLDNKNLKTAFSSQGFENISNFSDFYKFAIFWFLSTLTLVQFGLYFYGNFLDKKYQGGIKFYKASSRVSPINDQNHQDEFQRQSYISINQQQTPQQQPLMIQQLQNHQQLDQVNEAISKKFSRQLQSKRSVSLSDFELQKDQQKQAESYKNFHGLKISSVSKNLLQDDTLRIKQQSKLDNLSQNLNNINIQTNKEPNLTSNQIDKKSFLSINTEQNKNANKETAFKLTSNISNEQILQNNEITQKKSQDEQIITDEINQKNSNKNSEEEKKEKENQLTIEKYMSYPIMIRVLVFHDFFSIFFLYDKVLSRSIRFTIFYIRMIHCLSISTIFSQQYNEAQMIMVSILNSIVLQVSLGIIKLTHKIKKIGKYVSTFSMIILCLFYYYVILSIVSGQSAPSSNNKITSFFIMVAVDFVAVGTTVSILKMLIVSHQLNKSKTIKIIVKLFNLLNLQEIIQNLSI
ncbi:REJ domain protein (macronuclear) [Tetrahymena thermophila SB210]|uniref:REJ domain protein n=1 Tax=Tetrahymena thermophila (strain SB210) TaxID=312017 RepID=Q23NK9_TETTS|nr:REJ domain protein [Tetrahymena thermophila SB210]EAR98065.2 REJ domain protein [Tetrahymena thermophila SB210]|eukprot:XP_001018310.2 REJ domain protein [Tetrahymena thermophila SB210]